METTTDQQIQLSDAERKWIKLCKGHYNKKYGVTTLGWIPTLQPLFIEIYGWNPTDHYDDFLGCIFDKLLELHLKIQLDKSGSNRQLVGIFNASFSASVSNDYDKPIERVIAELCSLIRFNQVIYNDVKRYELEFGE